MKTENILTVIIILMLAAVLQNANATVTILRHDTSNYPNITTEFLAVDNFQRIVTSLNVNDVQVLDNNQVMPVTDFSGATAASEKNSLLISFDLSTGQRTNKKADFDSAKVWTNELISYINTDLTETALLSFDQISMVEANFTEETNDIASMVSNFTQSSAANIYHSLTSAQTGSIEYLNNSTRNRKSIILVTQGLISSDEANRVIELANKNGIGIYIMYISYDIPEPMQRMALQTGGYCISISDMNKHKLASFVSLVSLAEGYVPYSITASSFINCTGIHDIAVKTGSYGTGSYVLSIEASALSYLEATPSYLEFSSVLPGSTLDRSIKITAKNAPIKINTFSLTNPHFSFVSGNEVQPRVLNPGEELELVIRFAPLDSSIVFAELILGTDKSAPACSGDTIYMTGGFPNIPPKTKTIEITKPACTDVLVIGDTAEIDWVGLLPKDVIQLEYNIDRQPKWDTLAKNVTGLSCKWAVPDVETDSLLIRAIQLWPNNVGKTLDLKHDGVVTTAFFNNVNGDRVITTCGNFVYVWNSFTGELIHTFPELNEPATWAKYMYDPTTMTDKYIGIASKNSYIYIYNADDYSLAWEYKLGSSVNSIEFSKDGKYAVAASNDGNATIFEMDKGHKKAVCKINSQESPLCRYAEFHPTEQYRILTITPRDGIIRFFDIDGNLQDTINARSGLGYAQSQYATYNYNGSQIAFINITLRHAAVINTTTKEIEYTVVHIDTSGNSIINFASFFHDNTHDWLLTSGSDKVMKRWNAKTGAPSEEPTLFAEHTLAVNTGIFNADGVRVLSASNDKTAKVWNLDQRALQMDSTCYLRIARAKAKTIDTFDLGEVFIGEMGVKTITDIITNLCDFRYNIKFIRVAGDNYVDFGMLEELEYPVPFLANQKLTMNFFFRPTVIGLRYATVEFILPDDTVRTVLKGTGISKGLMLLTELINFGNVFIDDVKDMSVPVAINVSSKNINVQSVYITGTNDTNFRNFLNTATVKPNDTLYMPLRFIPFSTGNKNAVLRIEHDFNDIPLKTNLFGTGMDLTNDTVHVFIDDIQGEMGQTVELPIQYETATAYSTFDMQHIYLSLSFNASMLAPVNESAELAILDDKIDSNGLRTIQLSLPYKAGKQVIGGLKFRIALGNDSTASLNLHNLYADGSSRVFIDGKDAMFNMLNLCGADGTRLFDANGSKPLALSQSKPNPASGYAVIDYTLSERGYTTLQLFNQAGELAKVLVAEYMSAGIHSVHIDASLLPPGMYFYILRTPTQSISRPMLIE